MTSSYVDTNKIFELQDVYDREEERRVLYKNVLFYDHELIILYFIYDNYGDNAHTEIAQDEQEKISKEISQMIRKDIESVIAKIQSRNTITGIPEFLSEIEKLNLLLRGKITEYEVSKMINIIRKNVYEGKYTGKLMKESGKGKCRWSDYIEIMDIPRDSGNKIINTTDVKDYNPIYNNPSDEILKEYRLSLDQLTKYSITLNPTEIKEVILSGKTRASIKKKESETPVKLYHSTTSLFERTNPSAIGGNWFSLSEDQSQKHIIREAMNQDVDTPCYLYTYRYQLRQSLRLLEITNTNWDEISASYNLALAPFGSDDYLLSILICKQLFQHNRDYPDNIIHGWIFRNDQDQVMLCNNNTNILDSLVQFDGVSYFIRTKIENLNNPVPYSPPPLRDESVNEYNKEYFYCYRDPNSKDGIVLWEDRNYIPNLYRDTLTGLADKKQISRKDIYAGLDDYLTGIITNALRPWIYKCINILNNRMNSIGIFVLSGGEALNHHLDKNLRLFTGDIDTKFIPTLQYEVLKKFEFKPEEGFQEYKVNMEIRTKLWYEGLDAILEFLNENYKLIYETLLHPLQQSAALKFIGAQFVHPQMIKSSVLQSQTIFFKRLTLLNKDISKNIDLDGAGRILDIYLYAIDMKLAVLYDFDSKKKITKCGAEYFKKDELEKKGIDDLRKLSEKMKITLTQDENKKRNIIITKIIERYNECPYKFNIEFIGELHRYEEFSSYVSGVLDIAIMRPGFMGYDVIDECSIVNSRDNGKNIRSYCANLNYIKHDIDEMLNLKLRESKKAKDETRRNLIKFYLSDLGKPYLIPSSPFNIRLFMDYISYFSNDVTCVSFPGPCPKSSKLLYRNTSGLNESINKILVYVAPPKFAEQPEGVIDIEKLKQQLIRQGYNPDDLELYVNFSTNQRIEIIEDEDGNEKINVVKDDIFANTFEYRFTMYELSSERKTGRIILKMLREYVEPICLTLSKHFSIPGEITENILYNTYQLMKLQYALPYLQVPDPSNSEYLYIRKFFLPENNLELSKILKEMSKRPSEFLNFLLSIVQDLLIILSGLHKQKYKKSKLTSKSKIKERENSKKILYSLMVLRDVLSEYITRNGMIITAAQCLSSYIFFDSNGKNIRVTDYTMHPTGISSENPTYRSIRSKLSSELLDYEITSQFTLLQKQTTDEGRYKIVNNLYDLFLEIHPVTEKYKPVFDKILEELSKRINRMYSQINDDTKPKIFREILDDIDMIKKIYQSGYGKPIDNTDLNLIEKNVLEGLKSSILKDSLSKPMEKEVLAITSSSSSELIEEESPEEIFKKQIIDIHAKLTEKDITIDNQVKLVIELYKLISEYEKVFLTLPDDIREIQAQINSVILPALDSMLKNRFASINVTTSRDELIEVRNLILEYVNVFKKFNNGQEPLDKEMSDKYKSINQRIDELSGKLLEPDDITTGKKIYDRLKELCTTFEKNKQIFETTSWNTYSIMILGTLIQETEKIITEAQYIIPQLASKYLQYIPDTDKPFLQKCQDVMNEFASTQLVQYKSLYEQVSLYENLMRLCKEFDENRISLQNEIWVYRPNEFKQKIEKTEAIIALGLQNIPRILSVIPPTEVDVIADIRRCEEQLIYFLSNRLPGYKQSIQ